MRYCINIRYIQLDDSKAAYCHPKLTTSKLCLQWTIKYKMFYCLSTLGHLHTPVKYFSIVCKCFLRLPTQSLNLVTILWINL